MKSRVLIGTEIAKAIKCTQQRRIAFVYLINNCRDCLLDISALEFVVVSPRLGTIPNAVAELVRLVNTNDKDDYQPVYS